MYVPDPVVQRKVTLPASHGSGAPGASYLQALSFTVGAWDAAIAPFASWISGPSNFLEFLLGGQWNFLQLVTEIGL